jgi:hypothetical protein
MSNIATLLCALLLLAVNEKKSAPPVPATQGAGGWAIISQGAAVRCRVMGLGISTFPLTAASASLQANGAARGRADHHGHRLKEAQRAVQVRVIKGVVENQKSEGTGSNSCD